MPDVFDPSIFLSENPDTDTPVDPDEERAKRLEQQSIASKAGYNTWADYIKAVGENRAQESYITALQIKKLEADLARGEGSGAGVSRQNTLDSLAQSQRQFDAKLAQESVEREAAQQQFKEKYDFEKAKFNQGAVADAAKVDVQRGNTLLGLGSRPETLVRYLYALRGQQAPQQLGGTAPALPGYRAAGATVPGYPTVPTGAPSLGAPASINLPAENGFGGAPRLGQPGAPNVQTPENLTLAARNPAMSTAIGLPNVPYLAPQQGVSFSPLATNAQGGTSYANSLGQIIRSGPGSLPADITIGPTGMPNSSSALQPGAAGYDAGLREAQRVAEENSLADRGYADGGPIPEPVIGIGLVSGQTYTFGERGPETVVPEGKTLSDVKGKGGDRGMYAEGGTIGYAPDYAPKVFNPPDLSGIVARGYNTPGVPLLPQVGALSGGGQSLIPSAQSFFNALPSERSAYSGFLQDEAGVQPNDVFEIMKKLAPQATNVRTPRFAA